MKGVKKALVMVAALALSPAAAIAQDSGQWPENLKKATCSGAKQTAEEFNTQAPIQVDGATQLLSASAIYAAGECAISYQYMISEEILFKQVRQAISQSTGEEVPMEVVMMLLADGSDGLQAMKDNIRQAMLNEKEFKELVSLPFVTAKANYNTAGDHISNFTLEYGTD